jgi:hypothetical protein
MHADRCALGEAMADALGLLGRFVLSATANIGI